MNKDIYINKDAVSEIKINKIQLNNFRFFIDDEANNSFDINGENMLIYGENGSGKSSLFKAFEFLTKTEINEQTFNDNINIFKTNDTSLKFEFSNEQSLEINEGHLSLDDDFPFISKLSVTKPILDYKLLLKVSNNGDKNNNLYLFFKTILDNYPINDNDKVLKDLKGEEYFNKYKQIIQYEILDDINIFLDKFKQNIKITGIEFDVFDKTTFLEIEYFKENIFEYNNFLNEARLSALAISVYFAIIKKQFSLLSDNTLKVLVLDDLLISLDMNNRLKLIDILKSEFSDFQIFFFTHDKGLFETLKDKMKWKSYEIYTDIANDGYEIPFIKKSNSLLEQAKYYKLKRSYDCSANLLRQCTEKLLCKILPADKLTSKDCKNLDLSALLDVGISFEKIKDNKNQDIIAILVDLQTYRKILFNPSSHYDDKNIYKDELQGAITSLDKLENLLI